MNYLFIDFEYNSSNEEFLNLVCVSFDLTNNKFETLESVDIWLYIDQQGIDKFSETIDCFKIRHGEFVVLCWSANAEGRSFISAGLDPRKYKWIDLQAEYKMLLNHWHKYMYGKQMIKGKEKVTIPPSHKYALTEEEQKKANANKPESNLVAACYKLLNVRVDGAHKNKMRDIIIRNDASEILANKTEIMEYCRSDIKYLPMMFKEILSIYGKVNNNIREKITKEEMFWRGRSVVNTAIIENNGYPVNFQWAKTFTENVPKIQLELTRDIDSQFPEGKSPFAFDEKKQRHDGKYLKDLITPRRRIKYWKEWIAENVDTRRWMKTGTKNKKTGEYGLSTSYDAWQRYFKVPSNSYETGNFAHQVVRFLNFNKQLNGFLPAKKGKAKFIDFFGEDERVRGFLNSYGSQSGRFQPKAVSFLFLKSSWMRSMCSPKKGRYICGIDYSQQEFLISALLSEDDAMIDAYRSGDVYLHTAKLAGAVPKDGARKDYPVERNIYKQVTLAISYLMSSVGLSDTLTQSLKRTVDRDEAQDFIDAFYEVYSDFGEYMTEEIIGGYETKGYSKLADGFFLFGNNTNFRSYGNFPIQGMGSCILRKAIDMAIEENFKLIFPLHDALYFEGDVNNMEAEIKRFNEIMIEAFSFYFKNPHLARNLIRTDVNIWGPDLKNETLKIGDMQVKSQDLYIDDRAHKELEKFKKYMITDSSESNKGADYESQVTNREANVLP